MVAGVEIGTPKFQDTKTPALETEFQVNHTIGIRYAILSFRTNEDSGSSPGGKAEEGLNQAPIMEGIRRELAKVIETVHNNSSSISLPDRLRDFQCDRLSFDLRGGKDVIGLHRRKNFGSGRQINDRNTVDIHAQRSGICAKMLLGLIKGNQNITCRISFSRSQEVKTESRLTCSGFAMGEVHT